MSPKAVFIHDGCDQCTSFASEHEQTGLFTTCSPTAGQTNCRVDHAVQSAGHQVFKCVNGDAEFEGIADPNAVIDFLKACP